MSLSKNPKLIATVKELCRELRKNSTTAEDFIWENLRNRKLLNKKFYRQYPLYFDFGGIETFYIADFFCFEEKLVIEIDGGYHERQKEQDKLRAAIINLLGIKVIRFTNDDVLYHMEIVIKKIIEILGHPSLSKRRAGDEFKNANKI